MEVTLQIDMPGLDGLIRDEARGILRDVTIRMADRMKVKHADSKPTGNVYPRGGDSFHRASAPGQPPAVDTGNLLGSIQAEFSERELAGEITLNLYGWLLDQGTERVAARPWIMPSLDEVMKEFK